MVWWQDMKLKVLPVFQNWREDYVGIDKWSVKEEKEVQEAIKERMEALKSLDYVELMEPFILQTEEDFKKLGGMLTPDVDIMLPIWLGGNPWTISIRLGDLDKPIFGVGFHTWSFWSISITMALRWSGKESYYAANIDDPNLPKTIKLLWLKKALKMTRVLRISPAQEELSRAVTSPRYDCNTLRWYITAPEVKEKLGTEVVELSANSLKSEVEKIADSEAMKLADKMWKGATEIREIFRKPEKKYLAHSMKIYLGLKNLIKKVPANSIVGCWHDGVGPPCIPYVLLQDEGIPCACHGDLGGMLASIMLMYISGKPADYGQIFIPIPGVENMDDLKVPNPGPNTIINMHMITPLKMDGINKPDSPYIIAGTTGFEQRLTTGGLKDEISTNLPVTYTELRPGQDVTVARLGPGLKEILIVEGKIEQTRISPLEGNREAVYIKVPDAYDLYQKATHVGHHFIFVYGRYGEELSELCESLGIQVLRA